MTTLPFQEFWNWLMGHPNCILRAGTPEAVIFDDEDLHWHFGSESPEILLVQVLRGKRLLGELVVHREDVTYVQGMAGEQEGEFFFELISESENDRMAAYFFVLSHAYEEDRESSDRRIH